MNPPELPPLPCIRYVTSFDELVSAEFAGEVNAICWPRVLPGDFGEIVAKLAAGPGITTIDDERLASLSLGAEGELARRILLEDLAMLREHGLEPVLDHIDGYLNHDEDGPIAPHVQSFHVDSATDEADTYLCTYLGASSEAVMNDETCPKADVPEIRAALLESYGGADDEGFADYLAENFFDLHYALLPGARPWSFGIGNLWRIACEYPGGRVPPCVHRAPDTVPDRPRLLLIS